ncbi:cupin domain-containing protein [Streptomyces violaceusniger]|uniref:cupin domain-containing protein n=1 Tax=Streptomyces violaceusniger TaxID=68280 RepID=UPI0010F8A7A5
MCRRRRCARRHQRLFHRFIGHVRRRVGRQAALRKPGRRPRFYILSGSVRFTVGQDDYDAGAGTWVMVPPGAPHTFANVSDETAVMLNTFTPDLYVQYFRDLKGMVESGQPLSRDAVAEVWAKCGTEPSTEYAS